MQDTPIFKKLKDDEFYNLVKIIKGLNETSSKYYAQNWEDLKENSIPIFSRRQIIKNMFNLIMNNPDQISDNEKIFVIKLVRCYLSEAVE